MRGEDGEARGKGGGEDKDERNVTSINHRERHTFITDHIIHVHVHVHVRVHVHVHVVSTEVLYVLTTLCVNLYPKYVQYEEIRTERLWMRPLWVKSSVTEGRREGRKVWREGRKGGGREVCWCGGSDSELGLLVWRE